MKKAKLMLAAIAVLAIVGGVYASKAKRNTHVYCSTTTTLHATSTLLSYQLTDEPGITAFCTAIYSSAVPVATLITVNP